VTGWNIAEVAPAAPAIAELLAPLGMLCILIVCYGMVLGVDAIARAFFGTASGAVGWIPYAGSLLQSGIHKIEEKIVSFLAGLEHDIDRAIGHSWHALASVATHLWHLLERDSLLLWQALKFLSGVPTLHELLHAERWLRHSIKVAAHDAAVALRHAIRHEERALRSVAQGIYPRLRTLEHEVTKTLPRAIRHARSLAREAENAVARLGKRVQSLEQALSAGAIAAAVTTALAAVGLDWIACSTRNNVNGKSKCNLWDDIEALLAATTLVIGAMSLIELARAEQKVVGEAANIVRGFWEL
jgi:hypothetical protein